jgi:hypothetical protein
MAVIDQLNLVRTKLRVLGIPASTLAGLGDVSTGDLSNFLNGRKPCSNETAGRLYREMLRLEKLHDAVLPLRLRWSEVGYLQDILDKIDLGTLEIRITDNSTDEIHQAGLEALRNRPELVADEVERQ